MPLTLYFAVSRASSSRVVTTFSETPFELILTTSLMIREVSSEVWQPRWLRRLELLRPPADLPLEVPPRSSQVHCARCSHSGLSAGWDRWAAPAEASARRAGDHP